MHVRTQSSKNIPQKRRHRSQRYLDLTSFKFNHGQEIGTRLTQSQASLCICLREIYRDTKLTAPERLNALTSLVVTTNTKTLTASAIAQGLEHAAMIRKENTETSLDPQTMNRLFRLWHNYTRFTQPPSEKLAQVVWSSPILTNDALSKPLREQVLSECSKFKPKGIAKTAWALATTGQKDETLLRGLAQRALEIIDDFGPLQTADTLRSFASLGFVNEVLFSRLTDRACNIIDDLSPNMISLAAWSLCITGSELPKKLLNTAGKLDFSTPRYPSQMHIAEVISGIRDPNNPSPELQKFNEELSQSEMNRFQRTVDEALSTIQNKLGMIAIQYGQIVESVMTDFIVTDFSSKECFIVECDGDEFHHFSNGDQFGKDIIQDKLFQIAGYTPVHVRSSEWYNLSTNQRVDLLISKLRPKKNRPIPPSLAHRNEDFINSNVQTTAK